eukprot:548979_1
MAASGEKQNDDKSIEPNDIINTQVNTNKSTSKHVEEEKETLICDKCHHENSIQLEITQNHYECSNCGAQLTAHEEASTNDDYIKTPITLQDDTLLHINQQHNDSIQHETQLLMNEQKKIDDINTQSNIDNEIILILKAENYIIFEELIIDTTIKKQIVYYIFINNWDRRAIQHMDANSFADKISFYLKNTAISSKLKLLYDKICDRMIEKDDEKVDELRYSDDMLKLSQNEICQKMLSEMGKEERVVLSVKLLKINKRGKEQDCILLLTDKALYNVNPKQIHKCKSRIDLEKIVSVTISTTTQQFAIHISEEYDYRYKSSYKDRIALVLAELYERKQGKQLAVSRE